LDFYLDSTIKYGYELLREGSKVDNHIQRFDELSPGYKNIPLNDYLVVDFCTIEKSKAKDMNSNRKYVRIAVNEDFKGAAILYWSGDEVRRENIAFKISL
jgi:hypothetical protein